MKPFWILGFGFWIAAAAMASTPVNNGLIQGTLNGAASDGTLSLGNVTLTANGTINLSPSGGTWNLGNVSISGLSASALTGTIADARLSGNVTLLGSSIDLGSEVTGSLPWGSVSGNVVIAPGRSILLNGTMTLGGSAGLGRSSAGARIQASSLTDLDAPSTTALAYESGFAGWTIHESAGFRTALGLGNATLYGTDVPRLSGNNTLTGSNTFNQTLTVAEVTLNAATDGILSLTVNATAATLNGNGDFITLPNGNSISVIEDGGFYYWTDETFNYWVGRDDTAWSTPSEGAARLRAYLGNHESAPSYAGSGANVTITYPSGPVASWSTSNGDTLPLSTVQPGNVASYTGTARSVRLFNADNGKLYELKITGTPNPVLTLTEVTP
jgi:hypothetical protein